MTTLAEATLAFHSLGEIDLETRCSAASAAGFTRIGLSVRRTLTWLEDHPVQELLELLDRSGLRACELEVLEPLRARPDARIGRAFELARVLGSGNLQVTPPCEIPRADAVARLTELGRIAADQGAVVSLEFLPWTNVATLAAASDLVADCGPDGVGVCLDVWHLVRSGDDLADVGDLWSHVTSVQLNDGPLRSRQPDDLLADCRHNRLLPGLGEFDVPALLAAARTHAPGHSLSVEVISDDLRALGPYEAARRIAESVESVLARSAEGALRV